jgi:hypothetical protein
MKNRLFVIALLCLLGASFGLSGGNNDAGADVPAAIRTIIDKSLYDGAVWGLRVVDLETSEAPVTATRAGCTKARDVSEGT